MEEEVKKGRRRLKYLNEQINKMRLFFFAMVQQPQVGPGPPYYPDFTITLRHTTLDRVRPGELSVRRRDLYLKSTQHSQAPDINAPGGIRTRNPRKRAAADPRL